MKIEIKPDGVWYHGSNVFFTELKAGSTITQWRELAEAFSHKPGALGYDDDGLNSHNGTEKGYLYIIDEWIDIQKDIYQHPGTTMDQNAEFITKRPLKVKMIRECEAAGAHKASQLLFDLDGTLTDPKEGICKSVQYALHALGIEEPDLDKLEPFIGPPLADSFMEFYGLSKERTKQAIVKYRERFSVRGWAENKVYEGIPDMLKSLKEAGYILAVASSKPTVFVERILTHFGLRDAFSVVAGSELDGRRTGKEEVIEAVRMRALYVKFAVADHDNLSAAARSAARLCAVSLCIPAVLPCITFPLRSVLPLFGIALLRYLLHMLSGILLPGCRRRENGRRRLCAGKRQRG